MNGSNIQKGRDSVYIVVGNSGNDCQPRKHDLITAYT